MRHPSEGLLRRLVDEPVGVPDADRDHVAGCERCRARLEAIRGDAALVRDALVDERHDAAVDVGAAWRRLSAVTAVTAASAERAGAPAVALRPVRGLRRAARHPVVAAVAFALVLAGAGTAAANGWLRIFEAERVAPLPLSAADLRALPELDAYGELDVTGDPDLHTVRDAGAASAETGLDVPEVAELPRGVTGEPTYRVGGQLRATFTFSTEQARRAAAEADEDLPAPPAGLDGSQVRFAAGPGVAAVWLQPSGVPSLIVGRAVAPTGESSGLAFETVRDYLLSLPGLPAGTATALRTFNADGSTLPLPVPEDRVRTSTAEVDGERATVLTTRDGSAAAVVWVDDGIVTLVGGTLDVDEVLSVARGLR